MTQSNFFRQLFGRSDPVFLATEEAIRLMQLEEYDGAVDILHNRALRHDPQNRRALLHLGLARMLQGRLDEAEDILTPIAGQKAMDSEKAAAQIALERIAELRGEQHRGETPNG